MATSVLVDLDNDDDGWPNAIDLNYKKKEQNRKNNLSLPYLSCKGCPQPMGQGSMCIYVVLTSANEFVL